MLVLLSTLLVAQAEEEAEGFAMNDVGATLHLPSGWKHTEWADWSFKAERNDKTAFFKLWTTPYQHAPTEATAKAWAESYSDKLTNDGAKDVEVKEISTVDWGRPMSLVEFDLKLGSDRPFPGKAWVAAYESEGQNVHMMTVAPARTASRASQGLEEFANQLEVTKGPAEIPDNTVTVPDKFSVTFPDGWRVPVEAEMGNVRGITASLGQEVLPPESCAVAIQPPLEGKKPDVVFACELGKHIGVLDEHSAADMDAELRGLFFKDAQMQPAEQVQVADRLGLFFQPPKDNLRLGLVPFDRGLVTVWALGQQADAATLDAAVKGVMTSMSFLGPDGGQQIVRMDDKVSYYIKHRPTSPVVLGPAVLLVGLIGGAVVVGRRRGNKYADLADE